MRAKLCDFGVVRLYDSSTGSVLPNHEYVATERLDGRLLPTSRDADVYSMGVSMCELFTGVPPNRLKRNSQVHQIRQRGIRDLCKQMVSYDLKQRPSALETLAASEHVLTTESYKTCPPRRLVKARWMA